MCIIVLELNALMSEQIDMGCMDGRAWGIVTQIAAKRRQAPQFSIIINSSA
jgi:hypothetical protein